MTASSQFTALSTVFQKKTSTSVRAEISPHPDRGYWWLTRPVILPVIGSLEAQEYALFVSHEHPDGQVDFNVFSATRVGQPWGEFTFSFGPDLSSSLYGGPMYDDEPIADPQYAQKVSRFGNSGRWESVLLARLRFKPDQAEPTSL